MFKRRRATSNPAPKPPPSASASLAASKAFLRDQQSNASLSSSAAAAALRTHPTSPTSVADTVTKRMVRKASISSHGSGSPQQPPGLRRQSSTASMTERSFRSPSPSRNSPVVDRAEDTPPIPAMPKDVAQMGAVRRRASSLDPPNRAGSPARRGGGRGQSLDGGPRASPTAGQRVGSLPKVPEHGSDHSQSINFSRPISPPASATSSSKPARAGSSGWFAGPVVNTEQRFRGQQAARPKTSDANLHYEARNSWQSIQNAADKPVSTRRSQLSHGVEGARLSTGSMRAKPSASSISSGQVHRSEEPVDPNSADAVYDPSTRRFIRKQDAMARHRQLHEEEEPVEHHYDHYVAPAKPQSPRQKPVSHSVPVRYERVREQSPPSKPTQPSPIPFEDVMEVYPTPTQYVEHNASEHEGDHHDYADVEEENAVRSHSLPAEDRAHFSRLTEEDLAGDDIRPPGDTTVEHRPDTIAHTEDVNEVSETPVSPVLPSNQDSAYPRLGSPFKQASTEPGTGRGRGSVRHDRGSSLSPPRNARFAPGATDLTDGVKHHPLPRSISPAKSALKSSPSGSRRNSSPVVNNGRILRKGPLSEASDGASEDGSARKKKAIRVSFEETPVIAGTSAYGEEGRASSPTGLAQSRWSSTAANDNLDHFMRPRPALPSFGSIRKRDRSRDDDEDNEKVTETVSSSMSTSVASMRDPTGSSSDHAIGSILVNDFASGKQPHPLDPLPPEVTSVEGTGYYSDSGSSDTALNDSMVQEPTKVTEPEQEGHEEHSVPEPKTLTTPAEPKPPAAEVPQIAIQPASPNLSEKLEPTPFIPIDSDTKAQPEQVKRRTFVPGGWDDDQESEPEVLAKPQPSVSTAASTRVTFAEQASPRAQQQESESSEDDDSIYSDAYEEFTDAEDGGFASIDRILESSVSSPPSGLMQSRFAEREPVSPTKSVPSNEDAHTETHVTQAPSKEPESKLEKKVERCVGPIAKVVPKSALPVVIPVSHPAERKQKHETAAKSSKQKSVTTATAPQPAKPTQPAKPSQQSPPPRKSALKKTTPAVAPAPVPETQFRKTMRGSSESQGTAAPETGMRKSMRGSSEPPATASPETGMRKSMRTGGAASTSGASSGLAASRHSMLASAPKQPTGALQKKKLPAAVAPPKTRPQSFPAAPKTMAIAPTYDSDSDASASSFQKERQRRRAPRGSNDRYTMRRSMRADAGPTMRPEPHRVRSISPPRTQAFSPPPSLRKSMRPSSPISESGAPKSSRFSMRSLSPAGKRFSLGKSSKPKATSAAASKSAFSSRFDDSSDEEFEDRSKRFQSRFADSDDEDDYQLPPGLAPVRGIPKRAGDEDRDSTDLEDEDSDVERASTASKALESGQVATNGNVSGLQKSKHAVDSPKKEEKKRGGLFGLGKKKKDKETAVPSEPSEAVSGKQSEHSSDIPLPPPHRERDPNRPLTPIGEDDDDAAPPAQRSPKLQRRLTPQWGRSVSDSWPLPSPSGDEGRPQTADGAGAGAGRRPSLRSTLSKRSERPPTARIAVDPKSGKEVVVGRTGKKKKFQGLRRVLGLND